MKRIVIFLGISLLLTAAAGAAGFGDILKSAGGVITKGSLTDDEIVRGLKEALEIGTVNAVAGAGRADGYLGNPAIRIPLPGPVQKVESLLRSTGYSETVDRFVTSMNRAAEEAAPEAKAIFWDAIKAMSITDARRILNGGDNEATVYFEEKTSQKLSERFKPVVRKAMGEVGATRAYQDLDTRLQALPFSDSLRFDLDQYVTEGAMDGLFHLLAEEEAKIRSDPSARVTDLLQKVFTR
ncbi:MAG: DUF4197 domain-containing protein [Desulfobacterales bacterium]